MNTESRSRYSTLGDTGLQCHPLGFGCYRVSESNAEHEASLRDYLGRGGNLIDTSANYTDGSSERLVGHVVRDFSRDDLIIVTKGGYIQGENMRLARQHDFPEIVKFGEEIWHCIHPDFLRTQIERSLQRMRIETIDMYLLHNPEYFLLHQQNSGAVTDADQAEFYRRIQEAFRFLETQVDLGVIRCYGISSNNFILPESDRTMTSILRCLRAASAIRPSHHFRIVQLPLNLYEAGGVFEPNNDSLCALEFCRRESLGVLANRPLNAFRRNRLIRLADFVKPGQEPPGPESLAALVEPLREAEQRIHKELQISLVAGGNRGLAEMLQETIPDIPSPDHLERIFGSFILRPLQAWLARNQQAFRKDMRWQAWQQEYLQLLAPLFDELTRFLAANEQSVSDRIRGLLADSGYPPNGETLSRMSIHIYTRLPGLQCVLNGMRRLEYVEDSMGVPALPPVDGPGILRTFQSKAG